MISAKVRALRDRWRSPEGRALGIEAASWLAGNGRQPPRGVGEFEGRVDLRGFVFPDARQVGSLSVGEATFEAIEGFPDFTRAHWREIDLTGAVIRNARFTSSRIEDCRFNDADLFDWRLWESQITDCSFAKADMQGSAIGTGRGTGIGGQNGVNVWSRVNFDRANLNGAVVSECVFRSCSFRKTKLKGVWFNYVTFDGVEFEGLLDSVLFEARRLEGTYDPGPMRNVDFRGVLFRNCEFRAYHFENVQFDDVPGLRVIRDFPRVVERAIEIAKVSSDEHEREAIETLKYSQELYSEGDTIFVGADFVPISGIEYAEALDRLYGQAQRDLGLDTG